MASGNYWRTSVYLMYSKIWSVSAALEELYEKITLYIPQEPPNHGSDYDKTKCLHDAVIGAKWQSLFWSKASHPPRHGRCSSCTLRSTLPGYRNRSRAKAASANLQNTGHHETALWHPFTETKNLFNTPYTWIVLFKPSKKLRWTLQSLHIFYRR